MVDPDHAVAVWDDLISAHAEPDPQKARELLLRVQGRQRSAEMPETSLEPVLPQDEASLSQTDGHEKLPETEELPTDLHDLLAMFH